MINVTTKGNKMDYDDQPTCGWCDALGHDGGEFGDYCPAIQPRGWFEPSDPHDIYDGEVW